MCPAPKAGPAVPSGAFPQSLLALIWVGQADRCKEPIFADTSETAVFKGLVLHCGEVPPLAQALVHPSEPWVRAAAYDPWAKREARGLDGDLRGGVHWLRGGGGDGGSSGLWEYGRRGL